MDLANSLFQLEVKDAQILDSNLSSSSKEGNEELTDITFDLKTSVELFML